MLTSLHSHLTGHQSVNSLERFTELAALRSPYHLLISQSVSVEEEYERTAQVKHPTWSLENIIFDLSILSLGSERL